MRNQPRRVVMGYIKALDGQNYSLAAKYLSDNLKILGPSGESFKKPMEFLEMLRQHNGKYDIKKIFVNKNDVCLLYDLKMPRLVVFMCSWYKVVRSKIISICTVFDPRPFAPKSEGKE